jgi:hypothetical protein
MQTGGPGMYLAVHLTSLQPHISRIHAVDAYTFHREMAQLFLILHSAAPCDSYRVSVSAMEYSCDDIQPCFKRALICHIFVA